MDCLSAIPCWMAETGYSSFLFPLYFPFNAGELWGYVTYTHARGRSFGPYQFANRMIHSVRF